jgi:hypothetical protein
MIFLFTTASDPRDQETQMGQSVVKKALDET